MDQILSVAGSSKIQPEPSPGGGAGFVSPTEGSEQFTIDHLSNGRYNQYLIDTNYINTTGLDVLPVGIEGQPGIVVRRQVPTSEKWIHWTCERINAMPLLPALTTSDPNEIPIGQEILFCNVLAGLAGSMIWRVSGVNKYKLRVAKNSTSIYPIGSTPAEVASALSRFYGPEQFVTSIIDASAGAPSLSAVIKTLQ